MTRPFRLSHFFLCVLCGISAGALHAQAPASATRDLTLSAFGGFNGTWTGYGGGHNIGVTAALDLGTRPFFGLTPSVEVRGTYPFIDGSVDNQKDVLAGIRVSKFLGRWSPYGDVLFGRGQFEYPHGALTPDGLYSYTQTNSNVWDFGGGAEYTLSRSFALRSDAQAQRWATPVTSSGHLTAGVVTVGVVYRFFQR